jgi:hypothetical protein
MSFNDLDAIPNRRGVIVDADTTRPEELIIESWEPQMVELKEKRVVFGRYPAPKYTDIRLPGRIVAKFLFAIQWNAEHNCHEIQDFGNIFPPSLNGEPLKREECKPLSVGDVITIGPFRIEYTAWPPLSQEQKSAEPV